MTEKKKNNLHGFSDEHVELIRKTVASEAVSETEFQRFLYRASKLGLDPLDNQIHLLTRNQKNYDTGKWEKTNVIIVGIDGFRTVAQRSGKLAGVIKEPVYNEQGKLVRAIAKIYRNDWQEPAVESLPLREYCKVKDGRPVGMWATMPETLLKKCAEAAGYRMAFAAELGGGVYIEEELDKNSEPKEEPREKSPEKEPAGPETSSEEPEQDNSNKNQKPSGQQEPAGASETHRESFDKELLLLDTPAYLEQTGDYVAPAFSPHEDETYFLIGLAEDWEPNSNVRVTGKLVTDETQYKVYVEGCESLSPKEPETVTEEQPKFKLYFKGGPKDGKKATYVLGVDENGTQYYVGAAGDIADKLRQKVSGLNEGDLFEVTGQTQKTSRGITIEMESISA